MTAIEEIQLDAIDSTQEVAAQEWAENVAERKARETLAAQMELEYQLETYWPDQKFCKVWMSKYVAAGLMTENQSNICYRRVFNKMAARH